MTFIIFQRGATSWGFQVGRLWLTVSYLRFWKSGIAHMGWDRT